MNLVDWILNIAAIFLWMDWRSARSARPQPALSIASTIRAAGRTPGRGFGSLAGLIVLLLLRPAFYYTVGSAVDWTPTLDFIAISLPWRSDMLGRIYIFSTLSFLKALGFYYSYLLLLSAVNRHLTDEDRIQRFIRGQLGWLEKNPWWIKLLLPSAVAALAWVGLAQLFIELQLMPEGSGDFRGQAAAFALAAILVWNWLLVPLFFVHLVNIYLYIGVHPLWEYIGVTCRRLLRPLSFLRFGKIDLSPVAGIVGLLCLTRFVLEPLVVNLFRTYFQ